MAGFLSRGSPFEAKCTRGPSADAILPGGRVALTANHAGLGAVGEPMIKKGVDQALTGAARVVKRTVDATTDEITSELQDAPKTWDRSPVPPGTD
jgi:hypothetical protein